MAKFFAFFAFFFTFLFGAYENELANFDNNFIGSNKQAQVRLHHKLKSLYIQSIINEDEKAKIELLKRLIISSNSLNLDDKSYLNELKQSGIDQNSIDTLKKTLNHPQNSEPIKTPQKTKNSVSGLKNIEKDDLLLTQKSNFLEPKNDIYVLKASQSKQGVEFELSAHLNKASLKSFILNEKGNYRFISDFDAILQGGKKEFNLNNYRLVISQFNPKTVRIVVYAKEKITMNIAFKDKKMIFSKEVLGQKNTKQEAKKQELNKKPLYVLNTSKSSNTLLLDLSAGLDEKDLTVFNAKDQKIFRYIVSFKGILEGKKKNFVFGENTIIIAQYDTKTIRIVLSSAKEFKLVKKIDGKKLILGFSMQTTNQKISQNSNKPLNTNFQITNTDEKINQTANQKTSFQAAKLVVIDPGHGGKDSGALNDKKGSLKEKDIVLSMALKLGLELKKRSYKVLYTRTSDQFINLRDRTKYANDKKADLFISIHANAAPNLAKIKSSEGIETFFLSPARSERSKKVAQNENQGNFEEMNYFSRQSILNFLNREKIVASNKLAIDVQKNTLTQTRKKYKIVDGGVREAPFWVLVGAQMPAILIEIGYITHPNEGKRIANKAFQDLLVKGIADGIEAYFYNNR